ncbi:aldo/keto reductase [Chengkuizengella axinellae]|uniref:Aldo/keto reductase n=1 Tax=Chengkuizengella axinellae TaxID=3064388 RepID=A0ABT9IZJ8_9BACL|nr:aldo/keto reductase [Chengkuizengella sp. 2205SS18-9]MDP5274795.1 aldo/keto reductase [Chengkuizengella sp. 2205SS18-9]
MDYSKFAHTDRKISRLGFGAMGLNGVFDQLDDQQMIKSVLFSLDQGINFIDTARGYGRSEELIGKALKQWTGERPFIASKVSPTRPPSSYPVMSGWHHPAPVKIVYPQGSIRKSVETSLKQLDIESIDLIQLHNYWPMWDTQEDWMEELIQLKEEGKIKHIGVSVPDHRPELILSLVRSGKIDCVQAVINIFDPIALDCLVPICEENQVAVIARMILDEGGLTGFLKEDTTFREGDFRRKYFDVLPRSIYIEKVEALKQFIPSYADSLAELAIKFVLHHPGVTTAITSMQVKQFAANNIKAVQKERLPDDIFETLFIKHRWIRNFLQARRHMD